MPARPCACSVTPRSSGPCLGEVKTSDHCVRTPEQTPATQKERYAKGFHALLDRGVYLAPSGYEVSFLSTAHTEAHFEKLIRAFGEALR